MRLRRLLVATDGLDDAGHVERYASALARRFESELVFCYAVDHAGAIAECSMGGGGELLMPLVKALDDAAATILADAVDRAILSNVGARSVALDGRPVRAIVDCAAAQDADAIVLGSRGRRGLDRLFLGSTADGVLRLADVPVFVVSPEMTHAEDAIARVVVAIDDSEASETACDFAADLARDAEAVLVLCSVAETNGVVPMAGDFGYDAERLTADVRGLAAEVVARQAKRLAPRAIAIETTVVDGLPADGLLAASAQDVQLLVVGTHGRRGLRRLLLGSVAEALVRRSAVPVAVVRARPAAVPAPATVEKRPALGERPAHLHALL